MYATFGGFFPEGDDGLVDVNILVPRDVPPSYRGQALSFSHQVRHAKSTKGSQSPSNVSFQLGYSA